MNNKVINVLGVDYTEEKVQVLVDYLNYMENTIGQFNNEKDTLIEYMIRSKQASDKYLEGLPEENVSVLQHFTLAREKLQNNAPGVKLTFNAFAVFAYSMVSVTVPPILNLGICAILAKFVTNNIRNMAEKSAYNKLVETVKENLN